MKRFIIMTVCLLFIFSTVLRAGEIRQLTGSNGKIIEAEVLSLEGDVVKIKLKTGREMNVLLSKFADKDQEIIKQITSTEDPFDDDKVAAVDDPDKFTKPEKVRFTLEMSDKGRAKLRVEKVDDEPKQAFEGKTVTLPGFSKLDVKTRPDGISRVIYDCRSPLPKPLLYDPMNVELDSKTGKLVLRPNIEATGKNTDGWSILCMKQIMQLPMKISFDATITHKGECCNFEMLFSDCILTCHAYCDGNNVEDDMKILCRIGDKPFGGGIERVYQNVLSTNVALDEPFESSFTVSQFKNKRDEKFRGGIGRNLNRPEGVEIIRSPLEVNRISFEGRLDLPKTPSAFGPELLKVSAFKKGYLPSGRESDWGWGAQHHDKKTATISNVADTLKIVCSAFDRSGPNGVPEWVPNLTYKMVRVTKGKKYRVEAELRSTTRSRVLLAVDGVTREWRGFGAIRVQGEADWQTYVFDFETKDADSQVVVQFRDFDSKGVYELRRVSMQEILSEK